MHTGSERGTDGVKTYKLTDVGVVRDNNQDFVWSSEEPVGMLPNLFIVADGMGGHKAGDFASRFCVEEFVDRVRESRGRTLISMIDRAVRETNEQLILQARNNSNLDGMGTTFVMASILEDSILIANIGDSRLYIIDSGMEQITMDHSLVAEMVRNGDINEEAARIHPNKNIVTRALSTNTVVGPDFFEVGRRKDMAVLLCSDGLFSMISDEEIAGIVRENKGDPEAACKKLIHRANENGGKDNISVVLIYPDEVEMENEHD